MKPRYRKFLSILPVTVFISSSLPIASQAGIVGVNADGNAQPTVLNNGPNTIIANGGTSATPLVNIIAGVEMQGDIAQTAVLDISAANYTVTNAGKLIGTNHTGISSTFGFILTNSGTITGNGFDGIKALDGVTVTNNRGGVIQGLDQGIDVLGSLNFTNNYNTSVVGITNEGIYATTDALINNFGSIIGETNGITVTSGADIKSNWARNYTGTQIIGKNGNGINATTGLSVYNDYSGVVTGNTHGINATDSASITNAGTITGKNGNGINAMNYVSVMNASGQGGRITGTNIGVCLNDHSSVTNSATINGSNIGVWLNNNASVNNLWGGDGITGTNIGLRIGDDTIVNNYGSIFGKVGIDAETGPNAAFTLFNEGLVTGSTGIAIDGGSGTDTINLYGGSKLNGGINLMTGADAISMTSDRIDPDNFHMISNKCIVNGNIDGGDGMDVLTFARGRISSFLYSDYVSATNEVRGDVINMEDIIKNGSGTAFIGEVGGLLRTVRADAIHVNSGGLYINGNMDGTQSSQTNITNDGAQLGGTGTWDANITLMGASKISPGQTALDIALDSVARVYHSVGELTVTGNVTLDSTAAYEWNIIPGGSSDLIVLTGAGNAFITNNSQFMIAPTDVNQSLQDGSRVVVDTQTMLSGVFGSIRMAPVSYTTPDTGLFVANQINPILTENFSTLRKINSDQDWELTIRHDYSQFGATANQVAAGKMLNGLVSSVTGEIADLLAALDYSDAQTTINTLSALDPSAYLSTVTGLTTQNYHLHRTVESHNAAIRANSAVVTMPTGAPSAKEDALSAACNRRSNVWGSVSYDWQDLGNSNRGFDQTGDTESFTAGIDYNIHDNLRLGLVAVGSQTSWHGDSSLDSSIDSYNIAAYSNWGAATGWFVDALLGYNTHSVDQSRPMLMGNIRSISATQYDADGWQGLVSGGYAMQTSAGLFSPFMAFEWQKLSANSYETGGPIPVNVDSADIDSFRGLMGVKWEAILAHKVKGYTSAAYAYEFMGRCRHRQSRIWWWLLHGQRSRSR
ncbi:MAG: autotransporter domain-containing protein [Verrucomicrobiota bacterium]